MAKIPQTLNWIPETGEAQARRWHASSSYRKHPAYADPGYTIFICTSIDAYQYETPTTYGATESLQDAKDKCQLFELARREKQLKEDKKAAFRVAAKHERRDSIVPIFWCNYFFGCVGLSPKGGKYSIDLSADGVHYEANCPGQKPKKFLYLYLAKQHCETHAKKLAKGAK